MSKQKEIFEGMSKELASVSPNERANYLLDKLSELYVITQNQAVIIEKLQKSVLDSELFFSLPEVTLMSRSKLPRVVISAGDVVPVGDNFYASEPFGNNDFFRWTGPERLNNFHVPIDRSEERNLRLSIVNAIKPEILRSIKLYIDGELVSYDIEQRGEGVELITVLPACNRTQDTLVSMFIPHLFSPSEVNSESTDNRKLGVAFHQLEVM
ncbi:hypothetical protein [Marisediminitalea sp.]|jgi:hypothetical protein|uniref:hypothetical protein n=1 Tax=Marisediminitalea sp. TaxID=2662268 RepID=UPI003519BC7D